MAQIFTPMSSQLYTIGDLLQLQRTLVAGNRTCALITFPLCVILIVLGKPIIELWVGARYLSSYPILLILVIPRGLYLAQSASTKMLLGMGKHRWLALVLLMEGVMNLGLSIVLARRFGLTGVALGTAIPLTITSLFFLPYHTSHHLRIGVGSFLRGAYLMPLAISLPLASVLLFLEREFPTRGYRALLSRLVCGGGVYCTALYIAAFNHVSNTVRSWTTMTIEPRQGS
jgi:O-antigen/teichoic acid export membrane protein